VATASVGETRSVVEARIGAPLHGGPKSIYDTSPGLILHYTADDVVELVEIAHSGDGGEEVFFDGIQLTFRFIEDVVADLRAKGYACTPFDIGYLVEPGFTVWSMASRWALDLDPDADEEDERRVCEGVSVAPYAYFAEYLLEE
jgi:hypothetical protein